MIGSLAPWVVLGHVGNVCFVSRSLVQWLASERERRSVVPAAFWWLSLGGSLVLGAYAAHQHEPALLAGYALNGAIYARNLWIARVGGRARRITPAGATLLALAVVAALAWSGVAELRGADASAPGWLACALLGQVVWSSRFVVQWLLVEERGVGVLPPVFWWLSLIGNSLLLAYALHLGDPVFVLGYVLGPLVQVRNLALWRRSSAARA